MAHSSDDWKGEAVADPVMEARRKPDADDGGCPGAVMALVMAAMIGEGVAVVGLMPMMGEGVARSSSCPGDDSSNWGIETMMCLSFLRKGANAEEGEIERIMGWGGREGRKKKVMGKGQNRKNRNRTERIVMGQRAERESGSEKSVCVFVACIKLIWKKDKRNWSCRAASNVDRNRILGNIIF